MQIDSAGEIRLSATDLASHLGCHHLTQLNLRAALGELRRLYYNDPTLEVLREMGVEHERQYLAFTAAARYHGGRPTRTQSYPRRHARRHA
jgi:urease accessory protein UreE